MKKLRGIIAALLAITVFVAYSFYTGKLLMPKRTEYGSTWDSFLCEDRNTIDVLVCGSSLVYCDVIPAEIWEETGITSYSAAGPEQTIPISYYCIREACRTQTPKAVFLEVTGMYYDRYQKYTKVNLGYMPWGENRLAATFSAAEDREVPGLLYPLYDYHYRFFDITADEIKKNAAPDTTDILAGYTLLTQSNKMGDISYKAVNEDAGNYNDNLQYAAKLADFCSDRGIKLFLYLAPTKSRIPAALQDKMMDDLGKIKGAVVVDFNKNIDELGIDDSKDWYDPLHFNLYGARKFSSFLGSYMLSAGITPGGRANGELWSERAVYINSK